MVVLTDTSFREPMILPVSAQTPAAAHTCIVCVPQIPQPSLQEICRELCQLTVVAVLRTWVNPNNYITNHQADKSSAMEDLCTV